MVELEDEVVLDREGDEAVAQTVYCMDLLGVVCDDEEGVAGHVDFFLGVVEELEVFEEEHQFGGVGDLGLVSVENKKRCTISQLIALKLPPPRVGFLPIGPLVMHPQKPINVQFWRLFDLLVPGLKVVQH